MQTLINTQRDIITQEITQIQNEIAYRKHQHSVAIDFLEQTMYKRIEELNKLLYGVRG